MKNLNKDLNKAKRQKNDDFYTQLSDIERELRHYQEHFRNKVVYCNCDDPTISNFFRYFQLKFRVLGLKKLITTCYKNLNHNLFSQHDQEKSVGVVFAENGSGTDLPNIDVLRLKGDGDFRSAECIELLKQADIVVTNPPFSLFRQYVAQLVEHDKKFLVIGNMNAITYRDIFPMIRDNQLWLGRCPAGRDMLFDVPESYAKRLVDTKKEGSAYKRVDGVVKGRLGNAGWFTNLDHKGRHESLILYKCYTPSEYPAYDNYNAINVDKTAEIPMDWDGAMGVPITFLDKHNPEQFEILGTSDNGIVNTEIKTTPGLRKKFVDDYYASGGTGSYRKGNPTAGYYKDGVAKMAYKRIFIRHLREMRTDEN